MSECLILHPQRDEMDFLNYTGLVRHIYEMHEGKVTILVLSEFHTLVKNHFEDLETLQIEKISDCLDSTFLKLFIGKFKNIRTRQFFGLCDKFRTDDMKRKADSDDIDPYATYGFDAEIKYTYFRVNMNDDRQSKLMFQIKTVANMNYNITSKADYVPKKYKKNAMVSLNIDTMFDKTNFFDSIELIKHAKALYLTNNDKDYFTYMLYLMVRSNRYMQELNNKNIMLFNIDQTPLRYANLPEHWKIITTP